VDAYIFPCYSCGDPAGQVKRTVNYLQSYQCQYGNLWYDIEGPMYWDTDTTANVNFIQAMITQGLAMSQNLGIYTSDSQWSPITGGWTGASSYPLWYAHYDNNPSFDDFNSFGGWTQPTIKQYQGDATECSSDVDLDWHP